MKISETISISEEDIEALLDSYNLKFPKNKKIFDSNRREIIKNLKTQDFHAVAGSGKTTLLAFKLAILFRKWPYINQGICVLSHTNVAKDIIIQELSKIEPSFSLESHPHFIGTIQQFVDNFLAIPYIESFFGKVNTVDSDIYWHLSKMKFNYRPDQCLKSRHILFPEYTTMLEGGFENYCKKLNIKQYSTKKKREEGFRQQYTRWISIKNELQKQGIWTYDGMYECAQELISKYPMILRVIQYHFPFVIVDEAQDTNDLQYNLLENCFSNQEKVVFQRIGDPDQSIYAQKNSTDISDKLFERIAENSLIKDSYRFGKKIAKETSQYTCSSTILQGCCENDYEVKEILFPRSNPSKAILDFVNFILENKNKLPLDPVVKIIGAQGENTTDKDVLTISSYIPCFNKKNIITSFKTTNIFEALHYIQDNIKGNFMEKYNILCFCLSNATLNNKMTVAKFKTYLKDTHQEKILQQKFFKWIFKACPITKETIEEDLSEISGFTFDYKKLCEEDDNIPNRIEDRIILNDKEYIVKENSFIVDSITFCIDTIHGVKGETHDATLVLATQDSIRSSSGKNTNLERLRGEVTTKYKTQRKKLYVATSRAKYFLALAIPQDTIPST